MVGLGVGLPQIFLSTFPVFDPVLTQAYGWTRTQFATLFAAITTSIALSSPVFTWLVERFGIRRVLCASIIGLSISLVMMSLIMSGFSSFLFWIIIIGWIGTGTTTFIYLGVFPSWFPSRLGLALGIASAGIGLGQIAFPILVEGWINSYGWRGAYQILAGISLVMALPGALLIIRKKGAASAQSTTHTPNPAGGAVIISSMKAPQFWTLALAFFIIPMVAAGCTIHGMNIYLSKGLDLAEGARIIALGGFSLVVARVVAGVLLDVIGAKAIAIIACAAATVAPLILLDAAPVSIVFMAPLFYGLALGIEGDLMPYGLRNVFGAQNVPVLYGLFFGIFNFGVVTGPLVMGVAFDVAGSYDPALAFLSASALVALPLFLYGLKQNNPPGKG